MPGVATAAPDRASRQAERQVAPLLGVEHGPEPRLRALERPDRDDRDDRGCWLGGGSLVTARWYGDLATRWPARRSASDLVGERAPGRRVVGHDRVGHERRGRRAPRCPARAAASTWSSTKCVDEPCDSARATPSALDSSPSEASIRSAGPLSALPPMMPLTATIGMPRRRASSSASAQPGHARGSGRSRRSGSTAR